MIETGSWTTHLAEDAKEVPIGIVRVVGHHQRVGRRRRRVWRRLRSSNHEVRSNDKTQHRSSAQTAIVQRLDFETSCGSLMANRIVFRSGEVETCSYLGKSHDNFIKEKKRRAHSDDAESEKRELTEGHTPKICMEEIMNQCDLFYSYVLYAGLDGEREWPERLL